MEPLEWAAILSILASIGGGVYSGIQDKQRYDEEFNYRDNLTKDKFQDLISLGATPAYALQAAGGMSNASTGTSYNEPFNFAEALRSGVMSDLINANKAPFENQKNAADAAKTKAEADNLPRWYDAQINEMYAKAKNIGKNNEYLDFLIESGREQVAAEVQLKIQQANTEAAKVLEIMQNVNVLKATEKDIQSQITYRDGIQTEIGNASLENIEQQTKESVARENQYIKLLDKIQNEINVGESQIRLNNTIAVLNEAKEKEVNQETNNLLKDALMKDFQLYCKSLGFDKDFYIAGGQGYGDIKSMYAPERDENGNNLRRNMEEFQKFIDALSDYDEIANGTKGVVKTESGWPKDNKFHEN